MGKIFESIRRYSGSRAVDSRILGQIWRGSGADSSILGQIRVASRANLAILGPIRRVRGTDSAIFGQIWRFGCFSFAISRGFLAFSAEGSGFGENFRVDPSDSRALGQIWRLGLLFLVIFERFLGFGVEGSRFGADFRRDSGDFRARDVGPGDRGGDSRDDSRAAALSSGRVVSDSGVWGASTSRSTLRSRFRAASSRAGDARRGEETGSRGSDRRSRALGGEARLGGKAI